jgi:hypothetical protein
VIVSAIAAIGEYVWRSLDQSRRRPLYVVEATAGQTSAIDGRSRV